MSVATTPAHRPSAPASTTASVPCSAKAELEEALSALTSQVGSLDLASEARWVPYAAIRCFEPPVTLALGGAPPRRRHP